MIETNLAGIYTKIPYSNAMVHGTRHETIINWRHTEGHNSTAQNDRELSVQQPCETYKDKRKS